MGYCPLNVLKNVLRQIFPLTFLENVLACKRFILCCWNVLLNICGNTQEFRANILVCNFGGYGVPYPPTVTKRQTSKNKATIPSISNELCHPFRSRATRTAASKEPWIQHTRVIPMLARESCRYARAAHTPKQIQEENSENPPVYLRVQRNIEHPLVLAM